jgi:flagellar hook protein FlgE
MSINSAMYTGVTGLLSYSGAMSVVGNNLANVNTVGFKNSRAQFSDLLSAAEGGVDIGRGVQLQAVAPVFLQGVFQATGSPTDLALQGKGLFIVQNADGKSFYSRDGQFSLDKDGNLINPSGFVVQGFPLDENTGDPVGGLTDIVIGTGLPLPPVNTQTLTLSVNLDSREDPATVAAWPGGVGTDQAAQDWFSAAHFSTTVTVYDSLGTSHDLTYLFQKTGPNTWDYRAAIKTTDVDAAGSPDNLTAVGDGELVFNNDGSLDEANSTINDITIAALANGAADLSIVGGVDSALSFDGSTQYASVSALSSFQQDGRTAGTLTGLSVDELGVITGEYSNGGILPLYQLALADFPGVERLTPVGDNLYAQSASSGDPIIGFPNSGSFGKVLAGGLELSTVDVAQEFVTMIGAQRGFQANSRIITVADQMYDEAVNLKR